MCPLATFGGVFQAVYSLAFSPDGQRLALGTGEGAIKLWDTATLQEVSTLRGHSSTVQTLFFANLNTLVSVGRNSFSNFEYEMLIWSAE